jgi:hypothetical protein
MPERVELAFELLTETTFDQIPDPAAPGARCQTCDYWERVDGDRAAPEKGAPDAQARAALKRSRLLAGARLAGAYAMLAFRADAVSRTAVGYAQFGPLSAYPRAGLIRERYPTLPDSPAPWVVTCLQATAERTGEEAGEDRQRVAVELLAAVCDELDRRGITAVEAYPEGVDDPWIPSPGPAGVYAEAGFELVAGDDRYPVYRRELTGASGEVGWGDLLARARPADDEDDWPLPMPKRRNEDDLLRMPEKPKRPNPFGED